MKYLKNWRINDKYINVKKEREREINEFKKFTDNSFTVTET